eukprot:TRINITY_DN6595_c0_g1_i5.p1 TRINITY_DN6595_c0_g1~~TRINITY_DN6595_c0_g1_i5.p1  ORF type:complete len:443 (-),score=84.17 TRINITY_DN6595_c0_g1_i5:486-1814(-)
MENMSEEPLVARAKSKCSHGLLWAILIGVATGLAAGILIARHGLGEADLVTILRFPGGLWMKALKCVVMPLIICSMISSMVTLRLLPDSRRVALVLVVYTATTILAVVEGCVFAHYLLTPNMGAASPGKEVEDFSGAETMSMLDLVLTVFDKVVPSNIFQDVAEGRMIAVIVASVLVGLLIEPIRADGRRSTTLEVVDELNRIVYKVMTAIISLTPIGVASLVFGSAAKFDMEKVGETLLVFGGVVLASQAFHMLVVYPLLLLLVARRNPFLYYVNVMPAAMAVFGMASSAGALPLSIKVATEKNCIRPDIAAFVLPLGATINMDGTSMFLICSTCFLGALEGVTFDASKYITMSIMATMCSMGAAPLPSASLVFMSSIMAAVGVPMTDSFGLLVAVDWLLDRFRGVTNVTGDHVAAAVMNQLTAPAKDICVGSNDFVNTSV